MPRNITITFEDGSTHVYQNAPDDVTPEAVQARAEQEFNLGVVGIDGGRKAAPAPKAESPGFLDRVGDVMNGVRDFMTGADAKPESVLQTNRPTDPAFDFNKASRLNRKLDDQAALEARGTIGPITGPKASVSSVAAGLASDLKTGAMKARAGINQMAGDLTGSQYLLDQAHKERGQAELIEAGATPQFESETAQGAYGGLSSLVRQAPSMVAAAITRNPSIALGGMVAPMVPDAYGKYRERGATPGLALTGAALESATEYITEKLPMSTFISKFGGTTGFKAFAKEYLGKELKGEEIATLVQDAVDTAIANPEKTWGDYLKERPSAAYQTAVATLVQGGAMSGLHTLTNKLAGDVAPPAATPPAETAADLARSKGFLVPEATQPAPNAPLAAPKVEDQPTVPVAPVVASTGLQSILQREGLINGESSGVQPVPAASSGQDGTVAPASVGPGAADGNGVGANTGGPGLGEVGQSGQPAGGVPAAPVAQPGQMGAIAAQWDRSNRTSRNVEWQSGAALSNPAFNAVEQEGASVPAHGMAKVGTLTEGVRNLVNLLNGGIDPNKTLHYDQLTNPSRGSSGATAGGHAYRDGPFIITFREGLVGQPTASDIRGVLVNPAHAELVPHLQAMFPSLTVRSFDQVADVVAASRTQVATPPATVIPTQKVEQRTDVVPQTTSTLSPKAQDLQTRMQQVQNANNANTRTDTGRTLPQVASKPLAGSEVLPGQVAGEATGRSSPAAETVPQAVGDQPLLSAKPAAGGSPQAAAGKLELAPTAPANVVKDVGSQLFRDKKVLIQQHAGPLTTGQQVASVFASINGKTFTVVNQKLGAKNDMPNGFMVPGTNHIFVDSKAEDAPLLVAVHEIYHGLPTHIRKKLNTTLRTYFKPGMESEFGREFAYGEADFDEEIPAFIAQAVGSRPTFWEEVRTKMGNRDFAELAKYILQNFKKLLDGADARLGEGFLQKYIGEESKIAEAQGHLAAAYAQAMREQGLEPDAGVIGELKYSKKVAVGEFSTTQNKDGSMTVYGEADTIRGLLPEGITGRVVKGGIAFTHSDAPRVRHAIEGNKTAYSRAGVVTEKLALDNEGKYLGAPEKFNTPGKIPHLRKWLMKLTKEGEAGRFWYENSSKAVLRMVGGDVQEARKFVALLAIYSPQAKVDTNSTFALRAWSQHKAGKPISVKTGVMDSKAQRALDNVDEFWSGEKTGNFFTNLLSEIDPATRGKQGATIDMWMMRAAQYASDAPTKTQYAFMENETNRIARELGWEPQQVQAAIWVAMKARMENDGVKKATEAKSEKKGWIHYSYPLKNGKPQKTRVVDKPQEHRDNWLDHAIAHDPTKVDTQRAKFDFEDGLRRHIGQVSWEARPGRSTGVLPGVNDAPYDQQVEFQQAVQKALQGPNGEDLLAQQLGLLMDGDDLLAPGIWQGEVAAGMQKSIAMAPAKGEDGKTGLDETQKKNLDIYSAVLGLLLRQEGVGWHRPFYNGKASSENGVELRIGKAFTPEQAKELWTALDKRMKDAGHPDWEQGAGMISSPLGMRVVNFGALEDNKAFRQLVESVAPDVSFDADPVSFTSDGNLVMNDWTEAPDGQIYAKQISDSGRSDLLGWSRDVLAPRVQRVFQEFSEKYDWGNPGKLQFSNKPEDGRVEQDSKPARVKPAERANLSRDIVLGIPLTEGGTAKLTVNAKTYIKQLDAREDALRHVKECLA